MFDEAAWKDALQAMDAGLIRVVPLRGSQAESMSSEATAALMIQCFPLLYDTTPDSDKPQARAFIQKDTAQLHEWLDSGQHRNVLLMVYHDLRAIVDKCWEIGNLDIVEYLLELLNLWVLVITRGADQLYEAAQAENVS